MSASRMAWDIPADVRSHEFKDRHPGEQCIHCGAPLLAVAFFGGACTGPAEPDSYDLHCPTCDAPEPTHTATCAVVHSPSEPEKE